MTDRVTLELASIFDVPDRAGQLRRYRFTRFNFEAILLDPDSTNPTTEGCLEFAEDPKARRSRDTFTPMLGEQTELRILLQHRPQVMHDYLVRWTSLEEHDRFGRRTFEARFTLALMQTEEAEELG